MISVTSFKFNSSHYNLLIISMLSRDVTSDEFLTKTFIVICFVYTFLISVDFEF